MKFFKITNKNEYCFGVALFRQHFFKRSSVATTLLTLPRMSIKKQNTLRNDFDTISNKKNILISEFQQIPTCGHIPRTCVRVETIPVTRKHYRPLLQFVLRMQTTDELLYHSFIIEKEVLPISDFAS